MLQAIILAGGLGTRLAQKVPNIPKALAPIRGIPFLQFVLSHLESSHQISKVVMALGHQADVIEKWLSQKNYPFAIECSKETSPLGTGGALILALTKTDQDTLLILNGDSFCDLDIHDFYSFHQNHQADLSIATFEVDDTSRYGSLQIDSGQRIRQFREKMGKERGRINAGVYLIERKLIASCCQGNYSLEKDLFPQFLKHRVFAYPYQGTFIDIGTARSYEQAQTILP